MSPFKEEPSCRYLSPRVLSRSRYDAHMVTSSLRRSQRPRGPRNDRPITVAHYCIHPLSDFSRLQGMSCRCHQVGILRPSWVWSLLALSPPDETHETSGLVAPRSQVFATSQQVLRPAWLTSLFHPVSTPRVMVFRVLPRNDRTSLLDSWLLRRCLFLMASFPHLVDIPVSLSTAAFPDSRTP